MRDTKSRTNNRNSQRFNLVLWGLSWDRLAANFWKYQYILIDYFRDYDRRTGANEFSISLTWYSYRIVITAASLVTFFIGLAQCISKIAGG